MQKFIAIDEEGYFVLPQNIRLSDNAAGFGLLQKMRIAEFRTITTVWDGESVIVEAFDKPLIVQQIEKKPGQWKLLFNYGYSDILNPATLKLDAWDRFHGLAEHEMPFVFSRKAQAEFFNLLDEYDDDSITIDGEQFVLPPYYADHPEKEEPQFWENLYRSSDWPWDLGGPHPALEPVLPQIKVVKSRIVNFGCGRGHDAAFLASKGHIVSGVDTSETALQNAKSIYGTTPNLNLIKGDVFKDKFAADIVFEHTLFCAIPPERRKELVMRWHQTLEPEGYLLGVFFVMPKPMGPPYGCSEWELRALLEKHFRLLYWKRWPHSPPRREGTELVVFAQKLAK